jgi:signal transduction histidine kinase
MRLARRLSFALFLGVLTVVALFAYVRFRREVQLFDSDMRRDHRLIGTSLRPALLETWSSEGERRTLDVVRRADAEREGVRIRWVWLGTRESEAVIPNVPLAELSSGREVQLETDVSFAAGPYLVSYIPIFNREGSVGALEIAESRAHRARYLWSTLWIMGLTSLGIAFVCGTVAMGIGRWFVGRPVNLLIAKARRVGRGDLSAPLVLQQKDELGELAAELNSMCEHLARSQARLGEESRARIQALERLRHAERLTTIGQLTSVLAHEIGTPLNVVAGHVRMLAKRPIDEGELQAGTAVILEQCDRMTRIVRQVLDYARRREPKKARVNLLDVVQATVDLIRPLNEKHGVTVEVAGEGGAVEAVVDALQIQQALTNLIVNAFSASKRGDSVEIGVDHVVALAPGSPSVARQYVRIFVEDRGTGMTSETKARLFEPFFTTKDAGEGTGLGLSVANDIVIEHGGFIEVWSELGKGSRFEMYLEQPELQA